MMDSDKCMLMRGFILGLEATTINPQEKEKMRDFLAMVFPETMKAAPTKKKP